MYEPKGVLYHDQALRIVRPLRFVVSRSNVALCHHVSLPEHGIQTLSCHEH